MASLPASSRSHDKLPKVQLGLLLFVQFCEPLAYTSIFPYINSLLLHFEIAETAEKAGYYSGIIESLFFATEALAVSFWGRMSDKYGRKPVIAIGSLGVAISLICFGFSRSLPALIVSRALCGALNGNIGVTKAAMAELSTDSTRARAFSFMPIMWCAGGVAGPLVSGYLSPRSPGPPLIDSPFFQSYPYSLPCLVIAVFPILGAATTLLFFKETRVTRNQYVPLGDKEDALSPLTPDTPSFKEPQDAEEERSYSAREVMSLRAVRIAILNYGGLALVDITWMAVLNVFFFTPISSGGMGYQPSSLGVILAGIGFSSGLFGLFAYPPISKAIGLVQSFRFSLFAFMLLVSSMPLLNIAARSFGTSHHPVIYASLLLYVFMSLPTAMAFACTFSFVADSSPNSASLGIVNGCAQTVISILRAIGPVSSTSLFAFSIETRRQYLIYGVMFTISVAAIAVTYFLPRNSFAT